MNYLFYLNTNVNIAQVVKVYTINEGSNFSLTHVLYTRFDEICIFT